LLNCIRRAAVAREFALRGSLFACSMLMPFRKRSVAATAAEVARHGAPADSSRAGSLSEAPSGSWRFRVHGECTSAAAMSGAERHPEARSGSRKMRCSTISSSISSTPHRPGSPLSCSQFFLRRSLERVIMIDGGTHSHRGQSMFGRYQLAAVIVLSVFAAAKIANSATTEPALHEATPSEPAIQFAQLYSACRSCQRVCNERFTLCVQNSHFVKNRMRCTNRRRACLSGCRC